MPPVTSLGLAAMDGQPAAWCGKVMSKSWVGLTLGCFRSHNLRVGPGGGGLMRVVRRCNATGNFSWIGSDGWSARSLVWQGNERELGAIIFGSDQEVAGLMRAVRRCNATGNFSWIGSDGWSARSLVWQGNEREVEGTLSVQPQANPVVRDL
ncbi:hypothetical protein J6590_075320 [Homalodisca vitripennis]|nr:hypothetical protein J6590_075320 [Homalodisca vitripennis]